MGYTTSIHHKLNIKHESQKLFMKLMMIRYKRVWKKKKEKKEDKPNSKSN